jgi:general secretion pathway protein F
MAIFSYRATTMEGAVVEGIIEAPSENIALDRLRNTGVIPLRLIAPRQSGIKKLSLKSRKRDLLNFTTELSALINAGLPLDRSLNIMGEISESAEMKSVVHAILTSIREGSSFSDALKKHPRIFPLLYVNMVRAGETSGVIGVVLEKLHEFLETTNELKDHVVSAMIYPVILGLTGGVSIIVLLTFVLPRFSVIFSEIGGSLPFTTQMLLLLSNGLRSWWWIGAAIMAGTVAACTSWLKTEAGKMRWDALKLKMMEDVIRKLETARFCRTFGTLLQSGISVLQALNNSREIIGNRIIAAGIESVAKGAREGRGIAIPLAEAHVFPALALSMIKVGEETGQLDSMLLKVAGTYEKSLKESVKRFMGLVEPAMILGMGLMIGFIVISMLLAIFSVMDLPF